VRIEPLGVGVRHPELVLAQAGGDVRMGPGVDVRIDAQGDRGALAQPPRDGGDARQLRVGFDVQAADAARQG
jgi:hypothetical protein